MLGRVCAAAIVAVALLSSTAVAATYQVDLSGTLLSQGPGPDDPNFAVGDKLTLTARFDDKYVIKNFGGFGYDIAAGAWSDHPMAPLFPAGLMNPLETTGAEFWRIEGGGRVWGTRDDILDFVPWASFSETLGGVETQAHFGGPAIAFKDGKVIGLTTSSWMIGWDRPGLSLEHFTPLALVIHDFDSNYHQSNFSEPSFSPAFELFDPNYLYSAYYPTPGFDGVWDFANSKVSIVGVPEPSTWAMLLVGFFGLGGMLRRRTAKLQPT